MDIRRSEFTASEAKAHFSKLLDRAEAGEEIVIRRHGRVVAKLVAGFASKADAKNVSSLDDWFVYRDKHGPTLGPDLTIRQLIEEGRKY